MTEAPQNYLYLFENHPLPMWVYDLQTLRFLTVNNAAVVHYGYSESEFLGMTISDIWPREDVPALLENVAKGSTGLDLAGAWRHLKKDGSQIEVEITSHTLDFQERKAELVSIYDVTDRNRTKATLSNTLELLQAIFHSAPFIIMVLDEQARVLETNLPAPASEGLAGSTEDPGLCGQLLDCAHLGRDGAVCGTENECSECPIRGGLKQVMASGERICNLEVAMALLSGEAETPCHFSMTISPLRDIDSGKYLVTMIDITERKHAEQQRLEMERQLWHAQKLKSLGILAGSVSHDFNNLLMAIIGHLYLARQDVTPGSPLHPRLTRALRASQQATELTRQLLTYAGRGQFEIKPVDLQELARANAELFQVSIGRAVTLQLDLAEGLPLILADTAHLQQVIMNLITNASEAIGERPGNITLKLSVEDFSEEQLRRGVITPPPAAGRYLALVVADTGCGMDEETQQRIFDPFFTTKFTGRDLGMSATLGIIKGLHGALLIESVQGCGTTISVLFPLLVELGSQPENFLEEQASPEVGRFSGTLLIIDDEEIVRFITSEYARMFGFDVLLAENGVEGMSLFREHVDQIDCVLLDLTMPVMDGLETFRRIRQIRPDAKVILSSGYIEREATERFFGEGLAGFIQKPYDKNAFRQKLAEVLPSNHVPATRP